MIQILHFSSQIYFNSSDKVQGLQMQYVTVQFQKVTCLPDKEK